MFSDVSAIQIMINSTNNLRLALILDGLFTKIETAVRTNDLTDLKRYIEDGSASYERESAEQILIGERKAPKETT